MLHATYVSWWEILVGNPAGMQPVSLFFSSFFIFYLSPEAPSFICKLAKIKQLFKKATLQNQRANNSARHGAASLKSCSHPFGLQGPLASQSQPRRLYGASAGPPARIDRTEGEVDAIGYNRSSIIRLSLASLWHLRSENVSLTDVAELRT